MRRSVLPAALCFGLVGAGFAAAASRESATGAWNRDDGLGGIRITSCGDALCGHVVWLRDSGGPAFVGETVLFDMHSTAPDVWSGRAHNPEDGRDYAGTMVVSGDHLLTRGCVFGGLICKSVALSRPR